MDEGSLFPDVSATSWLPWTMQGGGSITIGNPKPPLWRTKQRLRGRERRTEEFVRFFSLESIRVVSLVGGGCSFASFFTGF
jgi:hypothetical protein